MEQKPNFYVSQGPLSMAVSMLHICEKTMIYNTNVDLINDHANTKFGLILSIRSQDIE